MANIKMKTRSLMLVLTRSEHMASHPKQQSCSWQKREVEFDMSLTNLNVHQKQIITWPVLSRQSQRLHQRPACMRICEASGENRARPNSRAPTSPLPLLFCGQFHGQKINKSGLNCGARNSLTPGFLEITEITKIRHLAVVLFFFFFLTTAVEEPQESRLEPSESHVHVTVLTFCSQRKNLVICIKERAPIFLSNTERERKSEGERWKWERRFHLQTSFKMDSEHYRGRTYAIYYTLI